MNAQQSWAERSRKELTPTPQPNPAKTQPPKDFKSALQLFIDENCYQCPRWEGNNRERWQVQSICSLQHRDGLLRMQLCIQVFPLKIMKGY